MNTKNDPLPTILIVDDEDYVRQSFCDYFEDHGWQVFSADSGETALELIKTQPCSAAVVDIRMGGMDGETFIHRAIEEAPGMIFIICTGSPEYEASKAIGSEPCVSNQIFSKPVTQIQKLEETIVRLLSKRQSP